MKRIRTKLVVSFLIITLLPVFPLYYVIKSFFEKSLEVGFNAKVENALDHARNISQSLFAKYKEETLRYTKALAASDKVLELFEKNHPLSVAENPILHNPFPCRILIYDLRGNLLSAWQSSAQTPYPPFFKNTIQPLKKINKAKILELGANPKFMSAFSPILPKAGKRGLLIVTRSMDQRFLQATSQIVEVNQMFKTLSVMKEDLQKSFILAFFVVYVPIAMLSLAIGFFFSQKITAPILGLAAGTQKVAAGNWDYRVRVSSKDELGHLVQSFNTMIQKVKEKQDQVVELEKLAVWREMARVLAHEIKNPLTPIQLTVQQLRDKYAGEDPQYTKLLHECTAIITDEIETLQTLVREFSDFARMPKLQLSYGNLNELIEETTLLYSDVPIQLALDSAIPRLKLDFEQMKRVLINLLENSVQSLKEKGSGQIDIATQLQENQVLLHLEDSGKGMPEDIQQKIFEPYFSTKKSGMGLGLAIVKRIIEEHGGKISVQSKPGEWTKFEIAIPVMI